MTLVTRAKIQEVSRPLAPFALPLLLTVAAVAVLFVALPVLAQSPWQTSSENLASAFRGPIAKALSIVAVVIGGLSYAFGEGQGKKAIAAIVFGCGMAVCAVNFMGWLGFGG